MSVCLFAHFYLINVKTAEPIGPKFCLGPRMTSRKVYGCSKLKNLDPKVLIFVKF